MKDAYEVVIKDKWNQSAALKGIKADSVDFGDDLMASVHQSLAGTLTERGCSKNYWDECIQKDAEFRAAAADVMDTGRREYEGDAEAATGLVL